MSDLQLPVSASPGVSPDLPAEVPRGPSARVRIGVGAAIVLVVVALVCSVLITALSPVGATTVVTGGGAAGTRTSSTTSSAPSGSISPSSAPPGATDAAPDAGAAAGVPEAAGAVILVHLLGAVARPGVYELAEGSRVVDAVGLAGGFTETAEQASVNLARPLADGEQVRVLAVGEAAPAGSAGSAGSGGSGAAAVGSRGGGGGAGAPAVSAPIDLNAATELDLDALPRIGPAMAARIVSWRTENGRFASVDDLLQVTGIGEKTLEGLRDLVTV
ncbi:helix-hairpin-helix domain-containing protein [Herbiconiux sp. YIM B11900]|uniref:helix-hairpin-helix domain-containing protein n=1 Tax=Herbiconiux sp. YIM B11900 TaxID=3404131 RepID=UPI003F864770